MHLIFIECSLYTKNWWGMSRSRTGCMEKRLFYDVTTAGPRTDITSPKSPQKLIPPFCPRQAPKVDFPYLELISLPCPYASCPVLYNWLAPATEAEDIQVLLSAQDTPHM